MTVLIFIYLLWIFVYAHVFAHMQIHYVQVKSLTLVVAFREGNYIKCVKRSNCPDYVQQCYLKCAHHFCITAEFTKNSSRLEIR